MPTKEQFEAYVRVQVEGRFNMLSPQAQALTGLDIKTYLAVLENYGQLAEKYPEVLD